MDLKDRGRVMKGFVDRKWKGEMQVYYNLKNTIKREKS